MTINYFVYQVCLSTRGYKKGKKKNVFDVDMKVEIPEGSIPIFRKDYLLVAQLFVP